MESSRSLLFSQELHVRPTKKNEKQKYTGVCRITTTAISSNNSRKNDIFSPFSVQSDKMHAEEFSSVL
jgi:hypothetical protein